MIDPVIDALTTPTSPCDNAINAMINSAALPNVAFNRPADARPCTRSKMFRGASHPAGEWNDGDPCDNKKDGVVPPGGNPPDRECDRYRNQEIVERL